MATSTPLFSRSQTLIHHKVDDLLISLVSRGVVIDTMSCGRYDVGLERVHSREERPGSIELRVAGSEGGHVAVRSAVRGVILAGHDEYGLVERLPGEEKRSSDGF